MICIDFGKDGPFQASMSFSFNSGYLVYDLTVWQMSHYSSKIDRDEFKGKLLEIPKTESKASVDQLFFSNAKGTSEIYVFSMRGFLRIRIGSYLVDVPYENVLAEMKSVPIVGEKLYRKYYTLWKKEKCLTDSQIELMAFEDDAPTKAGDEKNVVMEMASALMEQQKAMMEKQAKLLEGTASKEEIEHKLSSSMTKLILEEFEKIRQELKEERERERRGFAMESSRKKTEGLIEELRKEGKRDTPLAAFSRHAQGIRRRFERKMLGEKVSNPQTSIVLRENGPEQTMEVSFVRVIWEKYKDRFKGAAAELFLASVPYLIRLWTGEK